MGFVDLLGTYFLVISVFGQHDLPPPELIGSSQGPSWREPLQKPELQATRTLLRVYDEAQRLFQHVDVPMAWGPMVPMVGCNMSVILGAANFRGWDVETALPLLIQQKWMGCYGCFCDKNLDKSRGSFSSSAFAWWILLPPKKNKLIKSTYKRIFH